jgi:hypothetical protein
MNPQKEILDTFDNLKMKFEKLQQNDTKKDGKVNLKALMSKDYELCQNQLMNYFTELVMNRENLKLIIISQLDKKIWNLLVERISKVLKYKLEPSHLGKNSQVILQNLYSLLAEDLRNTFEFFRNVYSIISMPENYEEKDFNVFISNILNFMGDLKKLKLMLNKKFSEFKEEAGLNIEGDSKKDASDALRFFNYAINNNPYNTRIYSNIGFVYREFLKDHENASYWFIRALSCVDNELKKIKDNLEKDFNSIRKKFLKCDYIVNADKNNVTFLKYDLDYFPILFYRIVGILYMNIDIDKLENNLLDNFSIVLEKILYNYAIVPDNFKFTYEYNGFIEQLVILSIFNFHHNLNNLADYANDPQKIIFNSGEGPNNSNNSTPLLKIGIYNHKLTEEITKNNSSSNNEVKNSFKFSLIFLNNFIKSILYSMNEDNQSFIEKTLLILFYWLSLNYDVHQLLIDDDLRRYLKFFNLVISNDYELKRFTQPENQNKFFTLIDQMNNMILPIETTFFGFIPLNRFFVLNPKSQVLKVDDIKEVSVINKLTLIHFLDSFNLRAKNDPEIARKFFKRSNLIVKEFVVNEQNIVNNMNQSELKSKLLSSIKNPINLNVRKVKSLILLDASNIAMRHGDKTFSTKGIQIVMDYFTINGHKVLSFLPEYLFKENVNSGKKKRVVPDDIGYLNKLYSEGLVVQTPPQDYDDSYVIQYAKKYDAFIVTNDMYRDYLENIKDNRLRETERMWTKEKLISFTFNKDEFIPNPDSGFFKEFSILEYSRKASAQDNY